MATILYRHGDQVRVSARRVRNHLENGYFLTREELLGEEVPVEEPVEISAPSDVVSVEISTPSDVASVEETEDELSIEDVRLMADELGIQYPHNSGKEKLLARIENAQNGDSN